MSQFLRAFLPILVMWIATSSYLQVSRTGIKSRTSSTVDSFASPFNYKRVGRASDSVVKNIKLVDLFKLVGTGPSLVCCLVIRGSAGGFLLLRNFSDIVSHTGVLQVSQYVSAESASLTHHRVSRKTLRNWLN